MILTFKEAYGTYFKGKIGINKIQHLVKTNQIPTVKIPGKKIYFDSEALEKYLKTVN